MNGLRLETGALRQALGSTPRWRTERHSNLLGDQDLQNRVDQRGLTRPWAAGDHQYLAGEGDPNGPALAGGQLQTRAAFNPGDCLGGVDRWPNRPSGDENAQALGYR